MKIYTPDSWKIVKLTSPQHGTVYKVFAGWYGGYAFGDSWKLNSGIESIVEDRDIIDFVGASGSIYRCSKINEHVSNYMNSIFADWQDQVKTMNGASIELIDYKDYNG